MLTNGCTMTYGKGGLGTCANHAAMVREECVPHVRRSPQVRRISYHGAMRKHGGDRETRKDGTLATLDRIASVRVQYGPTVCVRKHA